MASRSWFLSFDWFSLYRLNSPPASVDLLSTLVHSTDAGADAYANENLGWCVLAHLIARLVLVLDYKLGTATWTTTITPSICINLHTAAELA